MDRSLRYFLLGFWIIVFLFVCLIVIFPFGEEEPLTLETYSTLSAVVSKQVHGSGCRKPVLNPHDLSLKRNRIKKPHEVVNCQAKEDWVIIKNGTVALKQNLPHIDHIWCNVTGMVYVGNAIKLRKTVSLNPNRKQVALEEDIFHVYCEDFKSRKRWQNVFAAVHLKKVVDFGRRPSSMSPNLLILYLSPYSRLDFVRQFPKTHEYITKDLGGIDFENYHITEEVKKPSLIPLLTGLKISQILKHNVSFNENLFKAFKNGGHVTAFVSNNSIGTSTVILNELDHHLELSMTKSNEKLQLCINSGTNTMFNWFIQLWQVYPERSKFAIGFFPASDAIESVHLVDNELFGQIKRLKSFGILKTTLVVLISEHPLTNHRISMQEMFSRSLPFLVFLLPKAFRNSFPNKLKNLKMNAKNRLTTPLDLHATLKSMAKGIDNSDTLNDRSYGVNLFNPIPQSRDCASAGIEASICTCLQSYTVNETNEKVLHAAKAVVKYMNHLMDEVKGLCHHLILDQVISAEMLLPNMKMLSRLELKGRPSAKIPEVTYQVKIRVQPSNVIFKATVVHQVKRRKFYVSDGETQAIDGNDILPHCVLHLNPIYRKYCLCKSDQSQVTSKKRNFWTSIEIQPKDML